MQTFSRYTKAPDTKEVTVGAMLKGTGYEKLPVTLKQETKARGKTILHVFIDGVRVGRIEKIRNTKYDQFPWKAFGVAEDVFTPAKMLHFSFDRNGKTQALKRIIEEAYPMS